MAILMSVFLVGVVGGDAGNYTDLDGSFDYGSWRFCNAVLGLQALLFVVYLVYMGFAAAGESLPFLPVIIGSHLPSSSSRPLPQPLNTAYDATSRYRRHHRALNAAYSTTLLTPLTTTNTITPSPNPPPHPHLHPHLHPHPRPTPHIHPLTSLLFPHIHFQQPHDPPAPFLGSDQRANRAVGSQGCREGSRVTYLRLRMRVSVQLGPGLKMGLPGSCMRK